MRALSIRQPWVELILRGEKDVENRSWRTLHRGPLLLHASRTIEREAMTKHGMNDLPTGCLVGIVDVVDCRTLVGSVWHLDGLIGWYLKNPVRFTEPIPWRGGVGIFHVPDDVVVAARRG